jgi:hypothetical protein
VYSYVPAVYEQQRAFRAERAEVGFCTLNQVDP